jgi:RNA polymerase sigma-70 factor (ECF subfamily)
LGSAHDDPGVQLMLDYQAGDEAAFERLVEQYSGRVWSLLTRFLGPSSKREDMVQEVFLRVIRVRERYRPTARFSTFLYRITFNLCVNETEKLSERRRVSLETSFGDEDGSRALQLADPSAPAPSAGLERDDVVLSVRRAIAALPASQRMALILAKYEGQSYAEVAVALDSSEKAIKSMIHRARERLREALAPFMAEELT